MAVLRVLILVGGVGVWLAMLPVVTASRVAEFRSNETLWRAAIRVNPTQPRARLNYAEAVWRRSGDAAEAERQLRIALQLLPTAPLAPHRKRFYTFLVHVELGSLATAAGRRDEGQQHFLAAASTDPRLVKFLSKRNE